MGEEKQYVKNSRLSAVAIGMGVFLLLAFLAIISGANHHDAPDATLPATGPRVPIPTVTAATLVQGERVYQREGCSECHNMIRSAVGKDNDPKDAIGPDLKYEGRRNADIDWQISNLRQHQQVHPRSIMRDYDNLSPDDLHALASYLATRK